MPHTIKQSQVLQLARMYLSQESNETLHRAITLAPEAMAEYLAAESMAGMCMGKTIIPEWDMAAMALKAANRALERLANPAEAMN